MIWHTLVNTVQNLVFYGIIWHTLVKVYQRFASLWYDMA